MSATGVNGFPRTASYRPGVGGTAARSEVIITIGLRRIARARNYLQEPRIIASARK
jgi:hypothetical protein